MEQATKNENTTITEGPENRVEDNSMPKISTWVGALCLALAIVLLIDASHNERPPTPAEETSLLEGRKRLAREGGSGPVNPPGDPARADQLARPTYDKVFEREIARGAAEPQRMPGDRERKLREERDAAVAEYREDYRLRQLYELERALGRCIRVGGGNCDCTAQAVTFVQAMQGVERMSMTRRRILESAYNLAEAWLLHEEGVDLADYLR
ncbi:MAG: hypothetical protein OXC00_03445 [Acidimicrobiaceae bacterium]|nr:hypothetical protein [Acidimicrobiaceae bacterium]